MLSVQIDQKTRDLPQPCSRYRLVVDAADAPGRCDFLRMIKIPSSSGKHRVPSAARAFSHHRWRKPVQCSAVTTPADHLFRCFSAQRDLDRTDDDRFPAPVSPVRMLSPSPNSTSAESIRARFFTCSSKSIAAPPFAYLAEISFFNLSIRRIVSSTLRTAHMMVSSPAIHLQSHENGSRPVPRQQP